MKAVIQRVTRASVTVNGADIRSIGPGLAVLLGVQELSLHAYWDNAVGLLTQFFYLPLLRLGAIVAMWTGQVFWFYFGAFLLLVLSSWLGCRAKDPVKK